VKAGTPSPQQAYAGARVTAPRRAVWEAASTFATAFTVEELHEEAREREPAVGLATTYRAVACLADTGWLERVGEREGRALYFRCQAASHHHHVLCIECGRVETAACSAAPVLDQALATGFRVTGHELTVYGVCPGCDGPEMER
jgi:Fur family ferric uptake transcriptional regulator